MWKMVNGERNMVLIVLFFQLFCRYFTIKELCVCCVCVCYVGREDSKDVSKCPL